MRVKNRRIVVWSLLGGLVVLSPLAWAGWSLWQTIKADWLEAPDPVGQWSGGTAVVEFLPEGRLGSAQVPAFVCSSRAEERERSTEIEGSWKKSFVSDEGPGIYVEARRKEDGGTCTFWLMTTGNGKDLWMEKGQGFRMARS
ncbi:hypothetical protein ACFU6K_38350 [Kitasatospora sp. NPDC057512]|uniref:hypothetical protein n=1 Tax=Kitasatospora sp. NPDC057512 TaxID=3346154 RepID=UPI0036A467BA